MDGTIQVNLFGSLGKERVQYSELPSPLTLDTPTPLADVLERLEIPVNRVQLVMVNHRAVKGNATIHPGDRVALFPREYPIFVDWNSYRL